MIFNTKIQHHQARYKIISSKESTNRDIKYNALKMLPIRKQLERSNRSRKKATANKVLNIKFIENWILGSIQLVSANQDDEILMIFIMLEISSVLVLSLSSKVTYNFPSNVPKIGIRAYLKWGSSDLKTL